jgi:transcriptional regulator with XRE-family HTH domain
MVAFWQVLRTMRQEASLSQEELASASEIERNFVSLIEHGVNHPAVRIVFKLANALGIAPSAMFFLVEEVIRIAKNMIPVSRLTRGSEPKQQRLAEGTYRLPAATIGLIC